MAAHPEGAGRGGLSEFVLLKGVTGLRIHSAFSFGGLLSSCVIDLQFVDCLAGGSVRVEMTPMQPD